MTNSARTRLFRGQHPVQGVADDHRGVAYGDGLFETMRGHDGRVPWWDRHWARLCDGAVRLGIVLPDQALVAATAEELLRAHGDGVLKLIVSRVAGGRGYAPVQVDASCDWQLAWHPLPATMPASGLLLRWCQLRLAQQPALAGIKHCNRLEQVLARSEWQVPGAVDADANEGLLCDADGNVICATAANVFVFENGRWLTPRVDQCGVAGVCRGWALNVLDAVQMRLTPAQVEAADAVFLCNAVRGILPVARLGDRVWSPHPAVAQARRQLGAAHAGFAR